MSTDKIPTPAGVVIDLHFYLTCEEADSVFSMKGCTAYPTPENIQRGVDIAVRETKKLAPFDWRLMTTDEVVAYRKEAVATAEDE
jgi:hypothetical protein